MVPCLKRDSNHRSLRDLCVDNRRSNLITDALTIQATTAGSKPRLFIHFRFCCKTCGRTFGRHEHLKRHIRVVHLQFKSLKCTLCQDRFGHKYQLDRHLSLIHSKPVDSSNNGDLQNFENKETDLLSISGSDGTHR